uniref:Polymerase nucleotidyl transferase domain-containing protein n=1 Tax=Panagrolaimus sp. ES5 TaxID=591445 RepID=A0AC34GY24_9BILA
MRNKIVSPTIIATHLSDVNNYEEVFGPISFVYCYNDDDDVSLYFNDKNGTYMRNKMYVSLYGENHYVSLRDDSKMSARNGIGIVLYNKNVHDFEEGHKAYGGYSLGASGVFFKNDENNLTSKALPIYIPEIIALHADQKIFNKIRKFKKPKKESMSNIVEPFHAKTIETFGDNLIFGFIFGSYAKGKARFSGKNASDLDVFICLKERNNYQESLFKKFIVKFQWENGLKPDLDYCCEIISFSELEISMCRLHKNPIQIYFNDESTFDAIIYLCALAGPKAAVIGNKTMLSNLTSQANNEVKRQSDLFIQSIEKCGLINRKILLQNNNGLIHRNDVLNFLKSCFKRGEYGDIIREFIPMGGEKILITQDDVNYNKTAFYKKCEQTQVFV